MYEITYLDWEENEAFEQIIKEVLLECYKEEKLIDSKLTIQITLTNAKNIRALNKEYRNIDRETDVLSFPMFEKGELFCNYISIYRLKNKKQRFYIRRYFR